MLRMARRAGLVSSAGALADEPGLELRLWRLPVIILGVALAGIASLALAFPLPTAASEHAPALRHRLQSRVATPLSISLAPTASASIGAFAATSALGTMLESYGLASGPQHLADGSIAARQLAPAQAGRAERTARTATHQRARGHISPTSAFILPSAEQCVAGRRLTVRLRTLAHVHWARVTVYVNGHRLETIGRARLTRAIELTSLPNGRFVLAITAVSSRRQTVTIKRTYHACSSHRLILTVTEKGTGTGTVSGGGISCPGTCSASVVQGTMVTLTAAAGGGSTFSGWSGGGCSGTGTCVVTMSAAESVTATFTATKTLTFTDETLSVSLGGTGTGSVSGGPISCPGTCSASVVQGTMVTLTAVAGAGSTFTGWSGGGCSGTGTCTVTMSSAESVTATFTAMQTLSVSLEGTGTGTVSGGPISCPGTCSASVVQGTMVTLTAVAGAGSTFTGWSGGGCSGTGTCTVTMSSAESVTATFTAMQTLSVSLEGTGTGSVSGGPISCPGTCSASVVQGTMVTLTAVAGAGSTFTGWSGGGCSGTGTCTVTMSSAESVTATFTAMQTLSVSLEGTGTGTVSGGPISCPGTCSASVVQGTMVTLTAVAGAGSTFTGWSGGGCSGTGTCVVTMSSAESVTATFTAMQTLSVSLEGTGTGTVSGGPISCPGTCSASVVQGTMVTLTAVAGAGSTFTGWSGGGCSGTGTCVVTMSSAESVKATFTAVDTLSVSLEGTGTGTVSGGGISCPGTCSTNPAFGSTVILYAAPTAGSTFTGWSGAGCEGTAFCVVNTDTAHKVTATFTIIPPSTLTVSTWGSGSGSVTSEDDGIDCPGTCSASYAYGTHVTLTAAAASGSTFVGWSGGGCSGTGTCVVTVDSALHVTASFQQEPAASETPGSYTGFTDGSDSSSVYFYVAPDGGSIEDVDIPPVDAEPSCTPSGSVSSAPVGISSIPINSDGSFSSTTTQTGLVEHQPATFTYTFDGQFSNSTTITGTWREEVAYSNSGTSYDCTTGDESFTASVNAGQSDQNTPTVSPGSYTGFTERSDSSSVYFYVAPDGGSIEDVDIPPVDAEPSCNAAGVSVKSAPIGIASIRINSDGSFSSTTTQTGLVEHQPATFTYTFNGHFHGPSTTGLARVDGIWREDVTYANSGKSYDCTTNDESFDAVLDREQENQNTPTASPGSYTGFTERSDSASVYFYVAPDGGSIEDVDIPPVDAEPSCTPSGSVSSAPVGISSIPINSDGSFSSETTRTGLVDNQPATFTYTFNGHFHGPNTTGLARVDGIWREDVTYANSGTSYSCTTGDESFTASLKAGQTGQNTPTASPGSYVGDTERSDSSSVYFYVAPDGGSVEDVDIPPVDAEPSCTPSGSVSSAPVGISSIPINSDGSFSSTTTQTGLVDNQPASFTYTFNGHFHGPSTGGLARVDGIWRVDVTYANSGTSYDCTSGNQSFEAVLESNQTGQNTPTASPGSYVGDTERSDGSSVYFTVSSDSATIENVSIPSTSLECSPSGILSSDIEIASIPIGPDGSFTFEESHSGPGDSETITYTFNGHVHGPSTAGHTRIDGIWRENITYANNGATYSCTTNNQSYSALFQPSG